MAQLQSVEALLVPVSDSLSKEQMLAKIAELQQVLQTSHTQSQLTRFLASLVSRSSSRDLEEFRRVTMFVADRECGGGIPAAMRHVFGLKPMPSSPVSPEYAAVLQQANDAFNQKLEEKRPKRSEEFEPLCYSNAVDALTVVCKATSRMPDQRVSDAKLHIAELETQRRDLRERVRVLEAAWLDCIMLLKTLGFRFAD